MVSGPLLGGSALLWIGVQPLGNPFTKGPIFRTRAVATNNSNKRNRIMKSSGLKDPHAAVQGFSRWRETNPRAGTERLGGVAASVITGCVMAGPEQATIAAKYYKCCKCYGSYEVG